MIYEYPRRDQPIRQGDIFGSLPRVDISLRRMPVVQGNNQTEETAWDALLQQGTPVSAIVGVQIVSAIVVTQDCDNLHARDITLCEIREFQEVEGLAKSSNTPKSWMKIITQQARKNLKLFYLPPDPRLGFSKKMGVDFQVTIRVSREELEDYRHLRRGRLDSEADEHFRERLGEFFRRYPYDEWYPLDASEFSEYRKDYPEIEARSWQTPSAQP